jgi:hypothetical protein
MGGDWNEPRDKGPEVDFHNEQQCEPWTGPRRPKKTFIIERRYVGPKLKYLTEMYENFREWHTDRKYKTERGRQEAFRTLTGRQGGSYEIYDRWEYRLV